MQSEVMIVNEIAFALSTGIGPNFLSPYKSCLGFTSACRKNNLFSYWASMLVFKC